MPRAAAELQGKVVVITGASGGIGRAAALEFASARCRLVLAARRLDALEATAALCRQRGGLTHVVATDVTLELDLKRLRDETLARWGRIDVWVNNAGTTYFARLDEGEHIHDSALRVEEMFKNVESSHEIVGML